MKKWLKRFSAEIALALYGMILFYLIPAAVTLCGGEADEKLYILLAVILPEAAGVIAYVIARRRYLFPILCMSVLPAGYGVFLYPWHADMWLSYYPDMAMCLLAGMIMAFFHIFIVLAYVLIGALAGGIADWQKGRRLRRGGEG